MDQLGKINELIVEAIRIRKQVADLILGLPDNENINRLNDNCFVMSTSQLSKDIDLSPEHYDYKYQYKMIHRIIIDEPLEKTFLKLNEIIRKGSITYKGNRLFKLHPQVIENLKSII